MKFALGISLLAFALSAQVTTPLTCAPGASGAPASGAAATWDQSGNATLLNGPYFFRYVQYTVGDQNGDLSHAAALFGTITFDSNSSYNITGMLLDSNALQAGAVTSSYQGKYYISACGFGYLTNPLSGDAIWGGVSLYGVFVGSTTETQKPFNDLFIAAPMASASASALHGSYSVAYMNFPDGLVGHAVTAGFQMAPDGNGNIGTVNIQMYMAENASPIDVPERANYSFSGGGGMLSFPTYGEAISRAKLFYISPDDNFVFGGGPDAFDIFVGVRTDLPGVVPAQSNAGYGSSNFGGSFFQAGIDQIMSHSGGSLIGSLQTYYGAFTASPGYGPFNPSSGVILDHQRILAPLRSPQQTPSYPYQPFSSPYQPFSYTYADSYLLAFGYNTGYTDTNTGREYVIGGDGRLRLEFGVYPNLGIGIALQVPADLPAAEIPPVYIKQVGVLNAASYAPYTSGISPGELIVIYGSNLATEGVTQVTVEGISAQVLGTPTSSEVTVIVPSNITAPYAQIQVMNGQPSNLVWEFVNQTTPGVFTQSENGLNDAYATHVSTGQLVTPANPALAGEEISIVTTGLGATGLSAGLGAGTPSSGPLPASLTITIGDTPAVIASVQPSPGNPGAYDIVVTVPAGIAAGEALLTIAGPDAVASQATLAIRAATSSSAIK